MSGARLETAGQVRGAFPFITTFPAEAVITSTSGAGGIFRASINLPEDLPFDLGPDKPGRLFIAFNGFFVSFIGDVITPTAPFIHAFFYYEDTLGKRTYLGALNGSAFTVLNNPNLVVCPSMPHFSVRPASIGFFCIDAQNFSLGSSTILTLRMRANMGVYGDYAEYDFNKLGECKYHEHDRAVVDVTPV